MKVQTYLLTRKHNLQFASRRERLNLCKSFRWICNDIVVVATSEQRAREIASQPMPTYGMKVSNENTIDIPYAWAYDVEPWIWADPTVTDCKAHGPEQEADKESISYRSFTEIDAGLYKKLGIGKKARP